MAAKKAILAGGDSALHTRASNGTTRDERDVDLPTAPKPQFGAFETTLPTRAATGAGDWPGHGVLFQSTLPTRAAAITSNSIPATRPRWPNRWRSFSRPHRIFSRRSVPRRWMAHDAIRKPLIDRRRPNHRRRGLRPVRARTRLEKGLRTISA
jgi:hypothetical protein